MLDLIFTRALLADSVDQFHRHALARLRPLAVIVMVFTVFAYVMFIAGRCVLVMSAAPLLPALPFVLGLSLCAWANGRTQSVGAFGVCGVLYVIILQVGALLNALDAPTTLLWLLPTTLLVPMCAAPFWLARSHFVVGTLASYAITMPCMLHLSTTREEMVLAIMWFIIGLPSAVTFHLLFYSYRIQHFVLEARLADLAATDPLTGVRNRRDFLARAQLIIKECAANGQVASALFIDIDHFKSINDKYGHAMGDRVITQVANVIVSQTRTQDLVGRLGGEEFAVLITTCPLATAITLAERLRVEVGGIPMPDGRVSVSLGVAELSPGESLATLLERADYAMLDAKQRGRDRVAVAENPYRIA
ncbi:GGDEF domain-containing protein [Robbsia sp. Bb-Pol-6]|uniref:diguanylate cyclase n=1 Tax=Robbsia betulipollinis TaxID=2981849 RepID=A0ABT3ZS72_9BURK|nr:GGDEF domain-containing protein [Robbsia betulipollinis]MCY0389404.1 GGDEF domain-containing protein [Robbsia betulipollinis]